MTDTLPPAGLDRRFSAFALDRAVAWTLDAGLVALVWWRVGSRGHAVSGVVLAVLAVALVTLAFGLLLGLRGTSPGRAAAGLRVVGADTGEPLGVGPALARVAVLAAATLPTFGIGTASLAWTAVADPSGRRRGWHDRLTGSVVVDVRPRPVEPAEEPPAPRQIVNLTALRLVPVRVDEPAAARPLGGSPLPGAEPAPPVSASPPPPDRSPAGSSPGSPADPADEPLAGVAAEEPLIVRPPAGVRAEPGTRTSRRPQGPRRESSARWRIAFDTGESLVVEGLVLVGRKPEPRGAEEARHLVPLRSQDMSLSKTHAQVHLVGGALVVMDRGSTNGSVLIRQGVSRDLPGGKPATLLDGDRVLFGDREMTVSRESGA
ncbi:MAG: RDD family protein [Nocardioidaceae bacterium]